MGARACREGLRLGTDGKKCADIDECAEGTAQCEQQCENLDPRSTGHKYVCKCDAGYSVDLDNQYRCIPKARLHAPPRADMCP
jgi:hypothetical protein